MKITFLGTGAADWPLEKPKNATEFRRLSSVLINDILLIDPGPQVLEALNDFGIDPRQIKFIINTHRHRDHFCAETVKSLEELGAVFYSFAEGDSKQVGKYTISAYKGNHSTCDGTVHFIINDGEKTLFYGLDGAWLLYDEVVAIRKFKPDFAVLDATLGNSFIDHRVFEHNDLNMVLEIQKVLKPYINTFCISHMARTLHTDPNTLSEEMKKYNIVVAFDGLSLEI